MVHFPLKKKSKRYPKIEEISASSYQSIDLFIFFISIYRFIHLYCYWESNPGRLSLRGPPAQWLSIYCIPEINHCHSQPQFISVWLLERSEVGTKTDSLNRDFFLALGKMGTKNGLCRGQRWAPKMTICF